MDWDEFIELDEAGMRSVTHSAGHGELKDILIDFASRSYQDYNRKEAIEELTRLSIEGTKGYNDYSYKELQTELQELWREEHESDDPANG